LQKILEKNSGNEKMENISNISSEDELLQLHNDGKISEAEYQDLLATIRKPPVEGDNSNVNAGKSVTLQEVPWQIWVVVALLCLEGVGNLLAIPQQPMALIWLGAKCIFVLGLLKRWKWVFCLFVLIGGIHVLYFMLQAPLVALINLVMIAFVFSSFRFYFPSQAEYDDLLGAMRKSMPSEPEEPATQMDKAGPKRRFGKIAFYLMLAGIIVPIVIFFICFVITGGGEGDVILNVCYFLCILVEILAFVLGVISWSDVFGKATVATISAMLVLAILSGSMAKLRHTARKIAIAKSLPPRKELPVGEFKRYPLDSTEGVLTQSGVTIDKKISSDGNGSLRIEATETTTVRLFETGDIDIENARLIYQARVRTENVEGQVYLEIRCRFSSPGFPGIAESFSKGMANSLSGTTDWTTQETPFLLQKGENPDNVKLNLVIEGTGTVWIDDIRLIKGVLN
jgi:hypothetical protein